MTLLLDSMLIVEQLRGRWRVKDAKLAPLHAQAMTHLGRLRRWSARHVPRSENRTADALANELPLFTCNPADFMGLDGLTVAAIPHPGP